MQPVLTEVADVGHRLLRALKRALTITTPYIASAGAFAGLSTSALILGFAPGTWAAGLGLLKSLVAIPPATVFCFAMTLSSLSLWRLSQKSVSKRRAARFCGALVALAGVLTLSQYLGAWDIPIPSWLFRDEAGSATNLTLKSLYNPLCFPFTPLCLFRLLWDAAPGTPVQHFFSRSAACSAAPRT